MRIPKDYLVAARRVSALWRKLEASVSPAPSRDRERNIFGQFWKTSLVEEQIANLRTLVEIAPDASERGAGLYSLAGLLHNALRLSDAEQVCQELIALRAPSFPPALNLLARISARRGNMDHALKLAEALEGDPAASFFRVSREDLQAAFEAGAANGA